jgi:hypothetical protein
MVIDGNLGHADAKSDVWKSDSFVHHSMLQCPILDGRPTRKSKQKGFGTSTKCYVDKGSDTRITCRDRQRSIKDLPCALAEIEVADLVSPWMCDGAEPLVGDLTASSI